MVTVHNWLTCGSLAGGVATPARRIKEASAGYEGIQVLLPGTEFSTAVLPAPMLTMTAALPTHATSMAACQTATDQRPQATETAHAL